MLLNCTAHDKMLQTLRLLTALDVRFDATEWLQNLAQLSCRGWQICAKRSWGAFAALRRNVAELRTSLLCCHSF